MTKNVASRKPKTSRDFLMQAYRDLLKVKSFEGILRDIDGLPIVNAEELKTHSLYWITVGTVEENLFLRVSTSSPYAVVITHRVWNAEEKGMLKTKGRYDLLSSQHVDIKKRGWKEFINTFSQRKI